MSVRLTGRIRKELADRLATAADQLSLTFTKVIVEAVTEWLDAHEGRDDGPPDDGRKKKGDAWNMNLDVAIALKDRIEAEAARRARIAPKRFPASGVDLCEEAMRHWLDSRKKELAATRKKGSSVVTSPKVIRQRDPR